jgi:probable HAF family extracellular repeat protein
MSSRVAVFFLTIVVLTVEMILPGLISAGAGPGFNNPGAAIAPGEALAGAASPRYIVTDIGLLPRSVLLGAANGRGLRMNNSGQVVGNVFLINTPINEPDHTAFLYSGGLLTSLSPLRNANDINNVGQIAGSTGQPVIRNSNGSITSLGLLPGDNNGGESLGINDTGQVVGFSAFTRLPFVDDPTFYFRAFLYSNGAMQDLGFGQFSAGYAINNSGQIVGASEHEFFNLYYSNGVITTFHGTVRFRDINNPGQATGQIFDLNNNQHALLYTNGVMQDLGTLPGHRFSTGYGINDRGEIVGSSSACCLISDRSRAFIYSNGVMQDLNDLISPGSGVFLDAAYDINEVGQIVAGGQLDNGNGPSHPFLLTPVQNFSFCLQDDSNGSLILINTTTGDYQFFSCTGISLGGTGVLNIRGGMMTLQHNSADRRILARIDLGVSKGTATIGVLSLGQTFTITDRNIGNNTCSCASR